MFRNLGSVVLVMALVLGLAGIATAGPVGSVYNPDDGTSLGTLVLTGSDTLDIDTGDGGAGYGGSILPTLTVNGTTVYTGTVEPNDGGAVVMAVFRFNQIVIPSGVQNSTGSDGDIDVIGNLGVVLASRSSFTFDATLDVKGGNGSSSSAGAGGPGAEGAARGAATDSDPPGSIAGNGGAPGNNDGRGRGAGAGQSRGSNARGGGGGYAGTGGDSIGNTGGGIAYGDNLLVDLYGGSGAGGAISGGSTAGGGGGGGSLALIALGDLTINGTVDAYGGTGGLSGGARGGGGSGGGVLLAGKTVAFGSGAAVNAYGGLAGIATESPGRGGRVAVYTGIFTTDWPDDPNTWVGDDARLFDANDLNALAGLTVDGEDNPVDVRKEGPDFPRAGTFYVVSYDPPPPPVSEPAGLGLLGLALLGLRKRRS